MSIGRNDPCPCGSGRKYKKCHFDADAARGRNHADDVRSPLHDLDNRVVLEIAEFVGDRFPVDVAEAGTWLFEWPFMSQQFAICWIAWIEDFDGRTAAAHYLADRGWSLPAGAREWMQSQMGTPLSIWQALSVDGSSLRIRDQFTGDERTIHDVAMSRGIEANYFFLGRIVDHDGVSVAAGVQENPLRPLIAAPVIETVRKTLRRKTNVPRERLLDEKIAVKMLSEWIYAIEKMVRPPRLANGDGDPFLPTTERWAFAADARDEVRARLLTIEGASEDDNGVIAIFRASDETITAFLRLSAQSLEVETNSLARADAIQAQIENVGSGLLTRGLRSHSDPESALREARQAGARNPKHEPDEDELAMMREYKAQYYAKWIEEPLPALDGISPRAASATREGRRKLVLLLDDLEILERNQPEGGRLDVAGLRRELGL